MTILLLSCSKNEQIAPKHSGEPMQFMLNTGTKSSDYSILEHTAVRNTFSVICEIAGTTSGGKYTYDSTTGQLLAEDPSANIYLPATGELIDKLTIRWPYEDWYSKNQKSKSDFIRSDQLICELLNFPPTNVVAISMKHRFPKITFIMGGDNVEEGIIYLNIPIDLTEGFDAFCGDATSTEAQLIIRSADELAGLLIGRVNFESQPENFYFSFSLPSSGVTPGTNTKVVIQ